MKATIFRIECQLRRSNLYSIDLEEARKFLKNGGYVQMSKLENNKKIFLKEEYWEDSQGLYKAKIVEVECINEINVSDVLDSDPMCTSESCAWNRNQYCMLPGICPGRNKM